jgi:hypothetical protein
MVLGCRFLDNYVDENNYSIAQQISFTHGDYNEVVAGKNVRRVWFQLVDMSKDTSLQGFNPPGRRFIPVIDENTVFTEVEVQVTLTSINSANVYTIPSSSTFANPSDSDWSICNFDVDQSWGLKGTVQAKVEVRIKEGTEVKRRYTAIVPNALRIMPVGV